MTDTTRLDALVTRNISDIESALAHARELGHQLIEDIADVLRAELGDAWLVETDTDDDDLPLQLARRDWLGESVKPWKGAYSFNFNEKTGPGDEYDETWFSTVMNAGPNGAAIAVYFWSPTFGPKRRWGRLIEKQRPIVDVLLDAGFEQDSDGWLYLPFALDPELVAAGYEADDLSLPLNAAKDLAQTISSVSKELNLIIKFDRNFE